MVFMLTLFGALYVCLIRGIGGSCSTWCGKNYEKFQPVEPPAGSFGQPQGSDTPFLAFRCVPRIQPYLRHDLEVGNNSIAILVDTLLTFTKPQYADSFISDGEKASLTILLDGAPVVRSIGVPLNISGIEIPLSLPNHVFPRKEGYSIRCLAETPDTHQVFTWNSSLFYLPDPLYGSVTQVDRKTGAILAKITGSTTPEPIFPIGFYTNFGGHLAHNLTVLDELKRQGFNVVHPVPPFDDMAALASVLDYMEEIGLFLMYDMRHSYQNPTLLSQEVKSIMARRNLLLWYTADEPDGTGDPLDATKSAYDLIYNLDGYHPVSLALNCANFFFTEYSMGADIIMPDVYMIGNNATFSGKYQTPCNQDFGCCGCDNCKGHMSDLKKRLDETKYRLDVLGWDRTKFIWSVTQAFGGVEFWSRPPTGKEWLAQAVVSINHGARGIIPWVDPTPQDIKESASKLAKILPYLSTYFFHENVSFSSLGAENLDIGTWSVDTKTLVLATNLDDVERRIALPHFQTTSSSITLLLADGRHTTSTKEFFLEPLGSAIFEIENVTPLQTYKTGHDEL